MIKISKKLSCEKFKRMYYLGKKLFLWLFFACVVVFCASFNHVTADENLPHIPGIIQGTGTHFEVTDSEYLNIILDSSKNIKIKIESMPEMVILEINALNEASASEIKLSGLAPNTTYHKYEDNYHNYAPVIADENGIFSFEQDLSRDHLIFIQPRKSTKFIKDDSTGGDCESIGNWNAVDKTCKLTQDITETIQIDSDNTTLDGNGHKITGSNTGSGVYVWRNNVTVKNIAVSGFYCGIQFYHSNGGKITDSILENNLDGVFLNNSQNITVSQNLLRSNIYYGIGLYYAASNNVSNNTIGPNNAYGISQEYTGNYNIYKNNNVFQNRNTGIRTYWGDYITMRDNSVTDNSYDGIVISAGNYITLTGNIMSGNGFGGANGKSNFYISGGDMDTNSIDESNTVENKPIYYKKNEVGKTYDGSMNIGSFYCINCNNITVKNLVLSEHASKIYFWHTNNSIVENVTSPDKSMVMNLSYSSGNTISKSTFDFILIRYQSNNNLFYNNNFMRSAYSVTINSSIGNLFNQELPIGGNYWKANTTSCTDGNNDDICDSAYVFNGGIDNYPWAKEFNQDLWNDREPIILVPGIGASVNLDTMIGGIFNDNWTLFSHTYDGIIEAFKKMGYEEGKDFFIAYYDWRNSNDDSARDYLKPLIKKANFLNGTSKVNIIAHSMGGLVARSYIQSDDYDNDVDNLFLIGTPNKGSSDVYPVWEGGYIPANWETKGVIRMYLRLMSIKNAMGWYDIIHNLIPSVKQLMPIYSYIYPKDNPQNIKNYSEMHEVNSWLENLNNGIQKLNDRVKVSVISGNNQKTVNGIPVIEVNSNPLWIDGKPEPLDPERNDSAGDNRVLLFSSQIQSLFNSVLNGTHGEIISLAEPLIAERLKENLKTIHYAPDIPSEMGFWFASPVDVEIKDPQGRIISGAANEIPLAKYASESKPDGVKIISIPNPVTGDYEIKITGNDNGEFHIGSEYFDYEDGENDASSILSGIIKIGEVKSYIVEYDSSNSSHLVTPAFPKGLNAIISYLGEQKILGTISSKEADFILIKLRVIKQLSERVNDKENVKENFQEQINRQIDWLIDYIRDKSDKKDKGTIDEQIKLILIESLSFIKFK